MQLVPTIICGGAGARLWPASQAHRPKPFMKIGKDGRSLLQQTFLRAATLPDVAEILTVTGADLLQATRDEFGQVNNGSLKTPFILEPFGRNTAAAIAIAALHCVQAHGEDSVMLVLPADHLIENQQAFAVAVEAACAAAQNGALVAFGINPDSAHTGYGYIEVDKGSSGTGTGAGWFDVRRFVEKPSQERAEEFLRSENYFWNSGMYCFRPGVLLQEMREHCPDIVEATAHCFSTSMAMPHADTDCIQLERQSFSVVPKESIDFAVMEKTKNVVAVQGRFAWSDIGSWSAIAAVARKDGDGNSGTGNSIFYNSSNCFVYGSERKIGIVGLDGIVIVDVPDGLLVTHRDQTQDVRHVHTASETARPKSNGLEKANPSAWGNSKIMAATDSFQVKRLAIEPGQSIFRHDSSWPVGPWIIAAGQARIIGQSGRTTDRTGGEAYQCGTFDHEIVNTGDSVLTLFEVEQNQAISENLASGNSSAS
jgi:mannose-1-phosphate guanylyltransferase / mannose-6-phosphate isomerase